jgi:hypothetical protein
MVKIDPQRKDSMGVRKLHKSYVTPPRPVVKEPVDNR